VKKKQKAASGGAETAFILRIELRNAYEPKENVKKDRDRGCEQSDEETGSYLVPNLADTLFPSLLLREFPVDLYFFYFFAGIIKLLFFH
jgi:hypothetical protein